MNTDPVRTEVGCGGLPKLVLGHASGAQAEVYLHGAHITSWRPPGQPDVFFMSRASAFTSGQPIRGGIPVVFPQFGDGPLPKHGFARTQAWAAVDRGVRPDGAVFVTLALEDTEASRACWPFRFRAELRLELAEGLRVSARVLNRDASPLAFQFALHTYFAVADIRRTSVLGLRGTRLADCLRANAESVEDREAVDIAAEVDRVYLGAPDELLLRDEAAGRTVRIAKSGMPDAVVWNPWIEKSIRMPDFGDDEYPRMLCVETGCIAAPVRLPPGQAWAGDTAFSVR